VPEAATEASNAPKMAPAEPKPAEPKPAEPKAAVAAVHQPVKPKAPVETRPRASKFVPAENVAAMRPGSGDLFLVPRGKQAGLTRGMVLQVVVAPVKDGKAKLVGEATVVEVFPRRVVVHADTSVHAEEGKLFVVLPEPSSQSEPAEPPAPEEPAAPRELSGRIALRNIGPFVQRIALTNTDTITWSGCLVVIRGRDVYKLDDIIAPGDTREIAMGDFERGGREVPFVGKNRVGVFCAEGQREFPARL